MGWKSKIGTGALAMALVVPTNGEAAGQEAPLMDRDEEMRLAMSAGPPAVSEDASIYVLGGAGFERVRDGDNGWACLVARSANDPQVLAPHCLNPHAVASVLPAMLAEARLQRRGLSSSEIDEELGSRWRSGEIPMPTGPAYAYMLSKGQHLGQAAGQFQPHFMLYLPNATNESVGGDRGVVPRMVPPSFWQVRKGFTGAGGWT